MSEPRKVTVRVAGNRSLQAVRELDEEAQQLRELLAHATEFTFRPNYGDLNDEFSDDPEHRDGVVLAWRGPSVEGGDPDRWAIILHGHWGWSRTKGDFEFGVRPSDDEDDDEFFSDRRFSRDEAVALMPEILSMLQDQRIPELRRHVESRARRKGEG